MRCPLMPGMGFHQVSSGRYVATATPLNEYRGLLLRHKFHMRPEESLAKRIFEAIVGGRMVYREDQSTRTHDFDLNHLSGEIAAVEVTSLNDETLKATYKAIERSRHFPRQLCS